MHRLYSLVCCLHAVWNRFTTKLSGGVSVTSSTVLWADVNRGTASTWILCNGTNAEIRFTCVHVKALNEYLSIYVLKVKSLYTVKTPDHETPHWLHLLIRKPFFHHFWYGTDKSHMVFRNKAVVTPDKRGKAPDVVWGQRWWDRLHSDKQEKCLHESF